MNAKDTVMTGKQLEQFRQEGGIWGSWLKEDVAKAQAEISFKAGEIQGYKKGHCDGYSNGQMAGVKAVEGWIDDNSWDGSLQHWGDKDYKVQCFDPDRWQAKLKEWGIE